MVWTVINSDSSAFNVSWCFWKKSHNFCQRSVPVTPPLIQFVYLKTMVSSAYCTTAHLWSSTQVNKQSMCMLNWIGHNTVPCRTPWYNWIKSELHLGSITFRIPYLRKLFLIDTALLSKFSAFNCPRMMQIESRAFERCRNAAKTTSLSLTLFRMFSVAYKNAPVVENLKQKSNCVLLSNWGCEIFEYLNM